VVVLSFWQNIVSVTVEGRDYDEEMLPGCGLLGSSAFPDGWLTDGLHLDRKGYGVSSKGLIEVVKEKWPELAAEKL
jgi:lysophospholipase L1-like esterase